MPGEGMSSHHGPPLHRSTVASALVGCSRFSLFFASVFGVHVCVLTKGRAQKSSLRVILTEADQPSFLF